MSISDQTGLYEAAGEQCPEQLQWRQSENRTVLTAHCKGCCVLTDHTTPWCSKPHTDVPHNALEGPHPVCFPFVSVWNLRCAFTIFRGRVKCAALFVRSCSPMQCPGVMDWINGLRMKPASFCLFSLTLGSPSYCECEVMSLLAH